MNGFCGKVFREVIIKPLSIYKYNPDTPIDFNFDEVIDIPCLFTSLYSDEPCLRFSYNGDTNMCLREEMIRAVTPRPRA